MDLTQLTQRLADLHISTIVWFVAALTVVRLALVRSQAPAVRAIVEIVEAALIAAVLVFMLIQPFIVKAFYIPSGSMIPTLIEDDHILVNKLEYRVENYHREDVIVFAAPKHALEVADEQPSPDGDPTDYIKRLMAMPGDQLQVFRGYITIGNHTYTHATLANQLGIQDTNHEHIKFEDNDIRVFDGKDWKTYSKADVAERIVGMQTNVDIHPGYVLRNGQRLVEPYAAEDPDYDLKIVDGKSILDDPNNPGDPIKVNGDDVSPADAARYEAAPPGRIPPGYVFAMGDNRNASSDSTRWGPLEEDRIVGKAFFIFFPFDRIRLIR